MNSQDFSLQGRELKIVIRKNTYTSTCNFQGYEHNFTNTSYEHKFIFYRKLEEPPFVANFKKSPTEVFFFYINEFILYKLQMQITGLKLKIFEINPVSN